MKKIATLAILLILFVGFAGAVTIPTPVYNAGHSGGDKFPGPVQVNDLVVDDDAQIGDDAAVLGDLAVTGAISAGAGTISAGVYDGDLRLAANHSLYSTTGTGGIDWSNATGIFKSPTGVNTLGGNTVITGTKTFMVNGGAATFGAALTAASIAANTTCAVGSADGLTINSVIVPQEMVLTIPIGASEVDQTAFIADDAWQITKIEEVHTVAQNTAYPNTGSLSVTKCTGTTAPGSGTALHNTTMQLNSTVNTVVTPTLNAATGALNLADGNRIALNFNGTMTTFAGGCVTIHMKRI